LAGRNDEVWYPLLVHGKIVAAKGSGIKMGVNGSLLQSGVY